jgi:hypothetical protein
MKLRRKVESEGKNGKRKENCNSKMTQEVCIKGLSRKKNNREN